MNDISDKLTLIESAFEDSGKEVYVSIKNRPLRQSQVEIRAENVTDDIKYAADIEKNLRDILGYGTFERKYDPITQF